jgi:hypothetical protein
MGSEYLLVGVVQRLELLKAFASAQVFRLVLKPRLNCQFIGLPLQSHVALQNDELVELLLGKMLDQGG